MSKTAFNRTAQISKQFKVIKKLPSGAYRTDLAKAAVKGLKKRGMDVIGPQSKPIKVVPKAGGK